MTVTTRNERLILAGMFALTNMGQNKPKDADKLIERLRGLGDRLDLDAAMIAWCEPYMESDEHYNMFYAEAKSWLEETFDNPDWTRERIVHVWPDAAMAFDGNCRTREQIEKALDTRRMKYINSQTGNPWVIRRNGMTKTWKTRPGEFRIPVKVGLKDCGYITHENMNHECFVIVGDPVAVAA